MTSRPDTNVPATAETRRPPEVSRARPESLERAPQPLPVEAIDRAVGSRAVAGNRLALQFEGSATFDIWLEAIHGAKRFVHFENYILRDDRVGRAFRDALVAKAEEGVPVRVLYDWVGCWATPKAYWKPFREAGAEVRAFNRPSVRDPFGVFQRDHRKLVCVDGTVAFVGGFCVGEEWAGLEAHAPWRDTGVEIRGPAAASCARAFERIWDEVGEPVDASVREDPDHAEPYGSTPVWVIEGEPRRSRVYRILQVVASHARERFWITDPYFVAPHPVSQALRDAARAGVDVRILVPARNNWPWVGSLSRGGYRTLMESGVRIFEWQGPMIHAKTSVADGVWGRVGSSNLNVASLLGNWEIDVGVLDPYFAQQLEGLFLADLASSVEIVLPRASATVSARPRTPVGVPGRGDPPTAPLEPEGPLTERIEKQLRGDTSSWIRGSGSGARLAGLARVGSTFGDAIAGHRPLGREDRTVLGTAAGLLLVVAALAAIFPVVVGWSLAFVAGWFGIVLGIRAFIQARQARREEAPASRAQPAGERSGGRSALSEGDPIPRGEDEHEARGEST